MSITWHGPRHVFPKQGIVETTFFLGAIRCYLLPFDVPEREFRAWWPRLSAAEKARYLAPVAVPRLRRSFIRRRLVWSGKYEEAEEAHNLITIAGRNQVLAYIGDNQLTSGNTGTIVPFAQYFSVGTGAIASVSPSDTGMIGELFRAVPSTCTISGNTVSISTTFGSTQANGTYTNAGIFGNNATSSLGSGTLVTHALYQFTKPNGQALVNDYIINLN